MRRRFTLPLALGTALIALTVSCSDETKQPTSPLVPDEASANLVPCSIGSVCAAIDPRIVALFTTPPYPAGTALAIRAAWLAVRILDVPGDPAPTDPGYRREQDARKALLLLQTTITKLVAKVQPADQEKANQLILLMNLFIFESPDAPVPNFTANSNTVVAIVTPTQQTNIIPLALPGDPPGTNPGLIQIDAGSVSSTVTVVATNVDNTQFAGSIGLSAAVGVPRKPCAGPLQTKLCQYPHFWLTELFPKQKLLQPAHLIFCHTQQNLFADHDRFELAHTLPTDPANYTVGHVAVEGGQIRNQNGENIEILPRRSAGFTDPITCTEAPSGGGSPNRVGPNYSRMIDQGIEHIGSWLSSGDLGLGGVPSIVPVTGALASRARADAPTEIPNYWADVDPLSQPDLSISGASTSSSSGLPGEVITLSYRVNNTSRLNDGQATAASEAGSGNALGVPTAIRIFNASGVEIAGSPIFSSRVPQLAPDESWPASGLQSVQWTVPSGLAPGTYSVRFSVDANNTVNGGLSEPNIDNNTATLQFTVRPLARVTAISSSLGLSFNTNAGGGVADAIQGDSKSQTTALNPLAVSVTALSQNGDAFVRGEGSAAATWNDAASGQLTFTGLGWETSGAASDSHADLRSPGTTDWMYRFTANITGNFTLNFNFDGNACVPPIESTFTCFGLAGFHLSWAEGSAAPTFEEMCLQPPVFQSCTATNVGSLTKPVTAGVTYTVRLGNMSNLFSNLGTRSAHMSGSFTWSVTPPPVLGLVGSKVSTSGSATPLSSAKAVTRNGTSIQPPRR